MSLVVWDKNAAFVMFVPQMEGTENLTAYKVNMDVWVLFCAIKELVFPAVAHQVMCFIKLLVQASRYFVLQQMIDTIQTLNKTSRYTSC